MNKVIYMWTNLINGKQYVGQSRNIERRKDYFKWGKIYANEYIDSDRKRYNYSDWEFTTLKECDESEADYWEQYYIKKFKTKYPNGYNITDGGIGMYGYQHTDETKKKMSEWRTKNQFGDKNPFWGKHWNDRQIEAHKKCRKKVVEKKQDGTEIIYNSPKEAADKNCLSYSSIAYACRGLYGTKHPSHLYKNSNWYYI